MDQSCSPCNSAKLESLVDLVDAIVVEPIRKFNRANKCCIMVYIANLLLRVARLCNCVSAHCTTFVAAKKEKRTPKRSVPTNYRSRGTNPESKDTGPRNNGWRQRWMAFVALYLVRLKAQGGNE